MLSKYPPSPQEEDSSLFPKISNQKFNQYMKYVKFDDESKREKMNLLNNRETHGVETVFDHTISDDERIRLGIPTKEMMPRI